MRNWATLLLVLATPAATAKEALRDGASGTRSASGQGVGRSLVSSLKPVSYPSTLNGVVQIDRSDMTVPAQWVDGPYRAVEQPRGGAVHGINIVGLKATNLQRDGIRVRNASDVLIADFDLRMRTEPQFGKHLPEGIAIFAGKNITIRDGRVSGFRMTQEYNRNGKAKYTNGDGIATEGAVDRLTIERVTSSNNSDGAFDLKGTNLVLRNLVATDSNRAFRIWSPSATATTLVAKNFRGAGIWLGKEASIVVDRFVGRSDKPGIVFRWESGASLVVKSCDLTGMARGSQLTKSDGSAKEVQLGVGCKLS